MKSKFLKQIFALALAAVVTVSGVIVNASTVFGANTPTDVETPSDAETPVVKPVDNTPTNGTTLKDTTNGYTFVFAVDKNGKITASFSAAASKNTKITVPSTVTAKDGKKYTVNKIAKNAFKNNTKVTAITVPTSIKGIGDYAFYGCTKLKTITINTTGLTTSNVTAKAFNGVKKTTTIKVPKAKLSTYKTLFQKKGLAKTVPVKAK